MIRKMVKGISEHWCLPHVEGIMLPWEIWPILAKASYTDFLFKSEIQWTDTVKLKQQQR